MKRNGKLSVIVRKLRLSGFFIAIEHHVRRAPAEVTAEACFTGRNALPVLDLL